MPELNLTQQLADQLLAIQKQKVDDTEYKLDGLSTKFRIPLESIDNKEEFFLDVYRSEIALKGSYQNRGRKIIILARLDFGGSPHVNPDGSIIQCPHLHVYREGFADKWAIPIPNDIFSNIEDLWETIQDFMKYCNIVNPPNIRKGLYI